MNNKISINKIIADIKATKGNRSGCQGLGSSLESDGYITSICKWVRATSPDRINALVEHVEKQDAALIAWEKTMMEACGEDGPASVANEIRSLRALRDTAIQALKSQVEQLAAENVYLLNGAARELNTSWMFHKTMLGAQAALVCLAHGYQAAAREWLEGTTDEAGAEIPDDISVGELHEWFDSQMISNDGKSGFLTRAEAEEAIRKACPATDRIVAGIKADGVEEFIGRLQQCVDDGDFVGDEVAVIVGAIDCGKEFCEQLREGADK
ncbi:TPA: hypothetical protein LVM08_003737 [Klebsiella oxytoca]|nr:hypothetical protein [Klebsiella oxytoca]